ncbi:MAG: cyclic dehypoxanthinyl futalosine synthase [Planctomycetia bacterium]|nr:cyclic dehypoxanthinyl futalosine synthase [Planctomycetia bacterium]
MIKKLETILHAVMEGVHRLTAEEAVMLLESHDLACLGAAAEAVTKRLHPENYRTYNVDRNINYTNVCECRCRFCGFSCDDGDPGAYVISRDEMYQKIDETLALGGTQILLQGGLNPHLRLEWFESLFSDLRARYPQLNIHGLSATEIWYLARLEGISMEEVMERLRKTGLRTIPGGGAEILVDTVRKQISPKKIGTDDWFRVMRYWHETGGNSTATMMFGHVETLADRVEHFQRVRDLQDETHGFTAFIAWTYQPFRDLPCRKKGAFEYLKTVAVARLFLDNVPNIQASWVTQGMRIGQLALSFGANDMGSLMIEENVVASCGTVFHASEMEMRNAIRAAGYEPKKRNVFYELLE